VKTKKQPKEAAWSLLESMRFIYESRGAPLWDVFSQDPKSFADNVRRESQKLFGPQFEQVIDKHYGKGSVDKIIKDAWKGNYTDSETVGEVGFYFDNAQQAASGAAGSSGGYMSSIKLEQPRSDHIQMDPSDPDDEGDAYPRLRRPRKGDFDGNSRDLWGGRASGSGKKGGIGLDDFEDL
jgi:hypothetical protein